MRNLIFAAAAVVALSFATSTAMADHFRHYGGYHHRGHVARRVVPSYGFAHHGYHNRSYRVPAYSGVHHGYQQPYYGHGYSGYSRGGIGINGRNLSLYIGF